MKPNPREKKKAGSALLVVLGFLSFMVVSAVAFAIYMRAERMPSSALRRNVATRHLVKAAMAQAMSRVDDAIRNDPFPGVANTNGNDIAKFYHDKDGNSMDLWYGRVFMPPNPDGLQDDSGGRVSNANDPGSGDFAWRFAPATETVSVLTLEALGYLPPPLVNDVRFLSRSTWTAKWQNFAYDAGRFAFCAVNVSDYLDVNRTEFTDGRSSPLDSCLSLQGTISATKKSDGSYEMNANASVSDFASIVGPNASSRPPPNDAPYVSMLDYNLALGDGTYAGGLLRSLFYPWIMNDGNEYFYGGTVLSSPGVQQAMRQPFVTDSFYAVTNKASGKWIDFGMLEGQVFPKDPNGMKGGLTFEDVSMNATKGSDFLKEMANHNLININTDIVPLYDYLDHDDIPTSLAMPSVECVPMVTAVELMNPKIIANLLVKPPATPPAPVITPSPTTPGPATRTTTIEYTLDPNSFPNAGWGVRVLVAFPFRHFAGRNTSGFKVQVAMKVFVASSAVSVRPGGDMDLRPKNAAEWSQKCTAFTVDGSVPGNRDVLAWSLYSDMENVTIPAQCEYQKDALIPINVTRWNWAGVPVPPNQPFFTQIIEEPGTVGPAPAFSFTPSGKNEKYQFNLRPFDASGKLVQAGPIPVAAGSPPPHATEQFRTYAMVWVRITDSTGNETYDLAPAVIADDMLNGLNNNTPFTQNCLGTASTVSGCLLFNANPTYSYTYADLLASTMTGLNGSAPMWQDFSLATVDPRYNYAPEDWFVWNANAIDGEKWLNVIAKAGSFNVGQQRDPDIFMFTSNQGFLQSLGEFAFLPQLDPSIFTLTPGTAHSSTALNIPHIANVWKTRLVDGAFYRDCEAAGICRSQPQTVNPLSDNGHILLAAFANTPCDYWTTGRMVALKMEDQKGEGDKVSGLRDIWNQIGDKANASGKINKGEGLEYAFCEKNKDSSAQMTSKELGSIMWNYSALMRGNCFAKSWEDIYDDLFDQQLDMLDGQNDYMKTDDNSENFMGTKTCPLYSIDRKFLYSYWRECFANNQQLFLIFVRAESTALGGPGEGTPAQQGGRAVALVWREPTAYDDGDSTSGMYTDNIGPADIRSQEFRSGRRPHRMRVLFYHQFD